MRGRLLPAGLVAVLVAGILAAVAGPARAEGLAFEPEGVALPDALAKARVGDRLVLVDLYTASCTWCKALDRQTFPSAAVRTAAGPTICVRLDAASAAGKDLVVRFAVRAYPTVLFLDADGGEVDRIAGFLPPERFAKEVARIRAGDGTLRALRLAHEQTPTSAPAAVAYARKLARAGRLDAARALLEPVANAAPGDPAARPSAYLGLAELALRLDDDATALAWATRLTDEFPSSPVAGDGWLLRVKLHAGQGEIDTAIAEISRAREHVKGDEAVLALETTAFWLHRRRTESTLLRWGERAALARDVDALHRATLAALEAHLLLGTALRWAETAAELSERAPAVLVTWAQLLAESGADEKALAIAREAEDGVRDADDRQRLAALLARLGRRAPPAAERDGAPPAPAAPAPRAEGPPPDPAAPAAPAPPPSPAPAPAEPPCPDVKPPGAAAACAPVAPPSPCALPAPTRRSR